MDPWIVELAGLALAVAASPFPVLAVVPLLARGGSVRGAAAFTVGWLAGLLLATAVSFAAFSRLGAGPDEQVDSPTWVAVVKLLLALGLLGGAARTWTKRPRAAQQHAEPGWLQAITVASNGQLAIIGVSLAALNPKILVLAAGGGALVADAAARPAAAIVAFTLVGSAGPLGLLGLATAAGATGRRWIDVIGRAMSRHGQALVALVLVVIGITMLLDAAASLR